MPKFKLPKADDLDAIASMLWDEEGLVADGNPLPVDDNQHNLVATYISDADELAAVVVADPAFASYSGASLTMMPKGAAEDAAKGDYPPVILENFNEIMNICSRIFLDDLSPHLRLAEVKVGPGNLPDAARSVMDEASQSRSFTVNIPKYGEGRIRAISL